MVSFAQYAFQLRNIDVNEIKLNNLIEHSLLILLELGCVTQFHTLCAHTAHKVIVKFLAHSDDILIYAKKSAIIFCSSDHWVIVLDLRVFVLDQWVFVLDLRVFGLRFRYILHIVISTALGAIAAQFLSTQFAAVMK